jgi:hypothetical protein
LGSFSEKRRDFEKGLIQVGSLLGQKVKLDVMDSLNKIKMASLRQKLTMKKWKKPGFKFDRNCSSKELRLTAASLIFQKYDKKTSEKKKIGFLKLRLNKLIMEKQLKENTNPHIALAKVSSSLVKKKLQKSFNCIKQCLMIELSSSELKRLSKGDRQESTLMPLSLIKSEVSNEGSDLRDVKNYRIEDLGINLSDDGHKFKEAGGKDPSSRMSVSVSFCPKIESVQLTNRPSLGSNIDEESRKRNNRKIKKALNMIRGLNILKNMEKGKKLTFLK